MEKAIYKIDVVVKAIEFMRINLDKQITSEDLARSVGYSPYHFTRIFKEVTGISPRHFLSALRVEAGKEILVNASSPSVLKTLLSIGFQSIGTFSTKFKQFVGLSPKKFQLNARLLHKYINQYQNDEVILNTKFNSPIITINLDVPNSFKGLIFIGLFPRPIPDQKPIMGTVVKDQTRCVFTCIPPGNYFIMAAAIPWSMNPKDYFILDKALRGKIDPVVQVAKDTDTEQTISLREALPTDPPILINLPQLLFEREKNRAN
ncbi:helix-turn-helix domain-containing protein [Radiobacillus sp. PE A8.2]|uniref:helix-turn-helix domain-containing protein n=1 Tax=Radiobacillus sp. PE A8.2 TaxID=3380349 RepID=UPI00388DD9A9